MDRDAFRRKQITLLPLRIIFNINVDFLLLSLYFLISMSKLLLFVFSDMLLIVIN